MKYILKKAEASVLVCSLKVLQGNLGRILSECPDLKLLILMDVALTTQEVSPFFYFENNYQTYNLIVRGNYTYFHS